MTLELKAENTYQQLAGAVTVVITWFFPEGAASSEGQLWHCN